MPFTLTCKCPSCDRVTSRCTDTSLSANRVEYDGVRCKRCTRKPRDLNHGLAIGTARGLWPSKKTSALIAHRIFTP